MTKQRFTFAHDTLQMPELEVTKNPSVHLIDHIQKHIGKVTDNSIHHLPGHVTGHFDTVRGRVGFEGVPTK